jgi:hypothetical protein
MQPSGRALAWHTQALGSTVSTTTKTKTKQIKIKQTQEPNEKVPKAKTETIWSKKQSGIDI